MSKKILYFAISIALFAACNSEETLSPSGYDVNWYALEDSDDALDHYRYEIYSSTGVTIFYNDVIGTQERGTDFSGNPIIYEEVLDPNYAILSNSGAITYNLAIIYGETYTESVYDEDTDTYTDTEVTPIEGFDEDSIMDVLEFLDDEIIPNLPSVLYPRCYLIVENLYPYSTSSYNKSIEEIVAEGMMCTVIGYASKFAEFTSEELYDAKVEIIAEEYGSYLEDYYDTELTTFYSYAEVTDSDGYDTDLYGKTITTYSSSNYTMKHWYEYGFLETSYLYNYTPSSTSGGYQCLSKSADIAMFVKQVLLDDDDAFYAEYESYSLITAKYEAMKIVLRKFYEDINYTGFGADIVSL